VVHRLFEALGMVAGWGLGTFRRVAELRSRLGLPAVPHGPVGWTLGQVRAGLAAIADGLRVTPAELDAAVREAVDALRDESEGLLGKRVAEEAEVAGRMAAARWRALAARALPGAGVLEKVIRQEGHLGRQLDLTLKQLARLKAARRAGRHEAAVWGSG
jgi:hypothetical protein